MERKRAALHWELVFCESCTQAASTRTTPAKTMSFHLVSTVSVPARRSIPRSIWTSPLSVTASSTACTLKGRKQDRHQGRLHQEGDERAQNRHKPSAGSPIWRYSRDINIPVDYYLDTLKRRAVVNSHIKFVLKIRVGSRYEDYRISLSERHCGLCDRAGRRKSADLGAVPRGRTTRTRPRRQGRVLR